MNSTSYDYKTEHKDIFDKQVRDQAKVRKDADLIACLQSKRNVAAYAQSNNLPEDLVMLVWTSR